MRKIAISLSFLLLLTNYSFAQQNKNDSLLQVLSFAKEDTSKVKLLTKLADNYVEWKPDSTLFYGLQALELSRKINHDKGEITALIITSSGFTLSGNYSKGLENVLEALKKSEAIGDDLLIARSFFSIAYVYAFQEDNKMSLPYWLKSLALYEKSNDTLSFLGVLINTGVCYKELNKLDSARLFLNKALELALRLKNEDNVSAIYLNLGDISLKMNQYDLGISYCKLAIPYYKKVNNPLFLGSIYNILGNLFDSAGRRDSAFFYSRLSYHYAKEMGAPLLIISATKQLSALYKESNRFDSAFIYQEIAINAKDSLTSQEKQKQVQALTFNEQLRQMEIEKQKMEAAAARKRNLELAGIAIFIPIFLFGILLLGRRKVKSRTIEFLGVLGLLFLFEFIILFAHPFIGHWTHESPVWMLLILVVVAAILIPLHHRSEAWIKKKLTTSKA